MSQRTYTWAQIEEINKKSLDASNKATQKPLLMTHGSNVIDISEFRSVHPGGQVIETWIGKDIQDVFKALHHPNTAKMLPKYTVGKLTGPSVFDKNTAGFVEECRKLSADFERRGLFKASLLYYAFKVSFNLSIWASSMYLLTKYPKNPAVVFLAGWLTAIFWQQSGWLAHDFLHNQVFSNRKTSRLFGYFVGNVWQGFSVAWWNNKHLAHHAVPNIHTEDPDIDTFPVLAWSDHALSLFSDLPDDVASRFFIKYQKWYFFPVLALARISWAAQSLFYSVPLLNGFFWGQTSQQIKFNVHNHTYETIGLVLHYLWYFGVMAAYLDWTMALLYLITSQAGCGLLLAGVFALNHNGMPIYSHDEAKEMDFFSLQVLTGRDVEPNLFNNWFTGGLNYQIEHHMFPTLPRHNFHHVQPAVAKLCKKYGVTYHTTGFVEGTFEVLKRLDDVSQAARKLHKA
ncbi:delta6-fatty acid desaturase [Gonapodya prolifera JEL478]|uniref:Delta6-fatty acid desaturase n=1 Tax=Gonapodya prolifera (strain JEL478) TaxID=1344416 RepID=A0A139A490_GONPJ|nr:delta6-fatty acid desaturase [Gonapodya prolifera JEL478]|eukprot:KXS11408.1 delta6-fatty acid desaturase [Gonapodya prolifera JEL478]